MSRLELLPTNKLNDAQRSIYDGIAGGKRATGPQLFDLIDRDGCLNGPFNALLYSPPVGAALSKLGEAIRFETKLSPRVREIAILVVSEEYKCEFEWYAHAAIGHHIGLDGNILEAIKNCEVPGFDNEDEKAQYEFCIQLVKQRKIDSILYNRVKVIIGESGILELSALVGYYTTLALIMNVFEISVPSGADTVFDQ